MRKFFEEFKAFAIKGNAFDLAIGVIIGSAFNTIVSSLVKDIIMPFLSIWLGRVNITDLKLIIPGILGGAKITVTYGVFLQAVINFVIIAFSIFVMIKVATSFHKAEEAKEEAKPADPSLVVLQEIRDLLKAQNGVPAEMEEAEKIEKAGEDVEPSHT
ncbi:MAG TPA: large conductance mechanosensitive channel protein MscL [Ruminococcaceae bacterium]|nr:large conductance mechanosensitive channel protein MscL [Oscillospiraceae bacterium]